MNPSDIQNFSVYRASAGSGKTYILTLNYIKLALRYPGHFKSILAVTFTNKATAEMKSRILDTLKLLAKGDHPMAEALKEALSINDQELQKRSDALLKNILHNYSFFAVTTIDAFFQKIVRSFAREVGIQTGFKIELDTQKVLSEVIDKMLLEMGENDQMVKWLTDFAIHQIKEGKSWDTRREIKSLSRELFSEFLMLNKKAIFQHLEDPDFMSQFIVNLKAQLTEIETGFQNIGESIESLLTQHGINQDDFTYKVAGVGGYMIKVINGQMVEHGKRVTAAIEEDKWCSKTSKTKLAVEAAVSSGLSDHVRAATAYYTRHHQRYFTIIEVIKYMYTYGLLSKIAEEINNYREEQDLLLISDFPVFLNEIINDSDTPYIYEKVGTRYKHYLIDEFQDTSGLQWNNFKPLVRDALSAGHFSMVVGDIKQSIYRWRGGNWKILLDQIKTDVGEEYLKEETLSTNRRSKQNVVEFNNDFFNEAPRILENSLDTALGEDISSKLNIEKAYQGSAQDLFDESSEGLIDIHLFEKEHVEDAQEYIMDRLIQTIQSLQDAKYQLNDIAILVRTNPQGRQIANALMAHALDAGQDGYKYDVISNESLFLKSNPAVHVILQGLTFVHASHERLSLEQLQYALSNYESRLATTDPSVIGRFVEQLDHLKTLNVAQVVEFIIHHFDMLQLKKDHAYVLAFQDLILDYLKYEQNTVSDFLAWWIDNNTRSIQVSEDQEAMRMMTVHKSKGLQFKVVLIPFCNWKFDHSGLNEQLLWCDTAGQEALSKIPFLPVRYKSDLKNTAFASDYFGEKSDIHLDNLNLLYVALTRAEEALYITCPLGKGKDAMADVSDLMKNYAKHKAYLDGQSEVYQVNLGKLPAYLSYEQDTENHFSLEAASFEYQPDRINLRYKSVLMNDEQIESINHGDIIHWIFSCIKSKEDFNAALVRAQVKFGLKSDELEEIKLLLRRIWDIPSVAQWYGGDWIIKNEASILLDDGKMKRPDRVVVKGKKAVVIDYKTGAKSDKHQRQVADYKHILNRMGYEDVDGYLIYMTNPELVAV